MAKLLGNDGKEYTVKSEQDSKFEFGQLLIHTDHRCIGLATGERSQNKFSVISNQCSAVPNSQAPEKWLAVEKPSNKRVVADQPILANIYYQTARHRVVDYWKALKGPHRRTRGQEAKERGDREANERGTLDHYLHNQLEGMCWYDYLQKLAFTLYVDKVQRHRDIFLVLPEKDSLYQTSLHRLDYSERRFCVTFDSRNDFLALGFSNMLMIDFDFEADYEKKREAAKEKLLALTSSLGFGWALFDTDHGLHAFLVSHQADYTQFRWIHLMLVIEADPWYAAFATVFGWQIRLNAKQARPDDYVARPHKSSYLPEKKAVVGGVDLFDFDPEQVLLFPSGTRQVDPVLLRQVRFHSYLTQLYRERSGKALDRLKCAIADLSIRLQVEEPVYTNRFIQAERDQILDLWTLSDQE